MGKARKHASVLNRVLEHPSLGRGTWVRATGGETFPPSAMHVLDRHGGFTIATAQSGGYDYDTLWRPGQALTRSTAGYLVAYNSGSFYQQNDNVTEAVYRVAGYGPPVLAWFDNATRERIA